MTTAGPSPLHTYPLAFPREDAVHESTASEHARGRVVGIALRSRAGGPMREVDEASAPVDGWLEGDHGGSARRGVTLLSREAWAAVNAELETDLPWPTRRANVCVEGLALLPVVGQRLRVGELELAILDETRPCERMDRLQPGLQDALGPQGRGGVYGRVHVGGRVAVGDAVEVLPANPDGTENC